MISALFYESMHGKTFYSKCKIDLDLNITEYEKFIDRAADSILHLTSKKLSVVEFWCNIKEEYPKLSEKAIKTLFQLV